MAAAQFINSRSYHRMITGRNSRTIEGRARRRCQMCGVSGQHSKRAVCRHRHALSRIYWRNRRLAMVAFGGCVALAATLFVFGSLTSP